MTNNSAAADNGAAPDHPLLHGVCAAMSSPFDDSGETLDERRLRGHVESLVFIDPGLAAPAQCGGPCSTSCG